VTGDVEHEPAMDKTIWPPAY